MNDFERSKDTLEALQIKSKVSLEDVLGVFLDVCEDVKEQGCSVDGLDVEDTNRLLTNLSRSGRIFLKIMKKKSDFFDTEDAAERIKRQEEQIFLQTEEINKQSDVLELVKAQWEEKNKYFQELSAECKKMRQMNEEISESISNEENEKTRLEKTLREAESRYEQLRKWFENFDADHYEKRLQSVLQRVKIFEDAQRELFYEIEELGLAQTISMQEANEKKEELCRQFEEIEDLIDRYQRKYKKICELLSD